MQPNPNEIDTFYEGSNLTAKLTIFITYQLKHLFNWCLMINETGGWLGNVQLVDDLQGVPVVV